MILSKIAESTLLSLMNDTLEFIVFRLYAMNDILNQRSTQCSFVTIGPLHGYDMRMLDYNLPLSFN